MSVYGYERMVDRLASTVSGQIKISSTEQRQRPSDDDDQDPVYDLHSTQLNENSLLRKLISRNSVIRQQLLQLVTFVVAATKLRPFEVDPTNEIDNHHLLLLLLLCLYFGGLATETDNYRNIYLPQSLSFLGQVKGRRFLAVVLVKQVAVLVLVAIAQQRRARLLLVADQEARPCLSLVCAHFLHFVRPGIRKNLRRWAKLFLLVVVCCCCCYAVFYTRTTISI